MLSSAHSQAFDSLTQAPFKAAADSGRRRPGGAGLAAIATLHLSTRDARRSCPHAWPLDCATPWADRDAHEEGMARQMTQHDLTAARLSAIVESSDDAIIGKTLDGIITSWNRAAERIFGHTAAEMIGQSITRLIPEERHAEEEEVL